MDDAVRPTACPEEPRPILQRIGLERRATLERLYQLYRYDRSEYNNQEINDDGPFPHIDLGPYVDDPKDLPQFILMGEAIAGFALVNMQSHAYEGRTVKNLDDFFVLRRYRRSGVGFAAARALFATEPGLWQINKKTNNTPAMAFWQRVVGEITGGSFREYQGQGIHVHIFEVAAAEEAGPR